MKNKAKAIAVGDGSFAFIRDGHTTPMICPFAPRVIVPGTVAGTVNLQAFPCSTACPLVSIDKYSHFKEDENTTDLTTRCGNDYSSFKITNPEIFNNQTNEKNTIILSVDR